MNRVEFTAFDRGAGKVWASAPPSPSSWIDGAAEGIGVAVDANSVTRNLGLTLGGASAGAVVASLFATGILATLGGAYHTHQAASGLWSGFQEKEWEKVRESSLYLFGSLGYAGVGVGASVYGGAYFAGQTAMLGAAATTFLSFSVAMGAGFAGLGALRWQKAADFRDELFARGDKVGDFEFGNWKGGMEAILEVVRPTEEELEATAKRLMEKHPDLSPEEFMEKALTAPKRETVPLEADRQFLGDVFQEFLALHAKGFERLGKVVGKDCAREMKEHWSEVIEALQDPSQAAYWLHKVEKGNYIERSRARSLVLISLITIIASIVALLVASGPFAPLLFGLGAIAWFMLSDYTSLAHKMADLSYRLFNWEDQMRLNELEKKRPPLEGIRSLQEVVERLRLQKVDADEVRQMAAELAESQPTSPSYSDDSEASSPSASPRDFEQRQFRRARSASCSDLEALQHRSFSSSDEFPGEAEINAQRKVQHYLKTGEWLDGGTTLPRLTSSERREVADEVTDYLSSPEDEEGLP